MTWRETWNIFTVVIWPLAVAAFLLFGCTLAGVWVARRRRAVEYRGAEPFLLAFCVLGLTVGFATAHSRTPAVAAVLPALLTLMSGVLTYSFSKEGLAQFRPILPHCITLLSIASLVGLSIGGTIRGRFDAYDRQVAQQQLRFERVRLEWEKAQSMIDLEIYRHQKFKEAGIPVPPAK